MNAGATGTTCPVCKHRYYPEDKSTCRVCSKCGEKMCTIGAARDLWTCGPVLWAEIPTPHGTRSASEVLGAA